MPSRTGKVGCCCRARRCRKSASGCGRTTGTSPARDLSGHDIACLFVDGIAERIRPGTEARAGACSPGLHQRGPQGPVTLDGRPEGRPRGRSVRSFRTCAGRTCAGRTCAGRTCAGAGLTGSAACGPGRRARASVKALGTCFPASARQRCLAHRMRNLAARGTGGSVARSSRPVPWLPVRRRSGPLPATRPTDPVADCESRLPGAVALPHGRFRGGASHIRQCRSPTVGQCERPILRNGCSCKSEGV